MPVGGQPLQVLVLDDQPDVADALGSLLRSLGHTAHVAYDGAAALELANRVQLDVAIIDLTLRDMDGRELARSLRAQQPNRLLRLFAISGYDVDPSDPAGDDPFELRLEKPPEIAVLERALGPGRLKR